MKTTKCYGIRRLYENGDAKEMLLKPMTHKEACTLKGKMNSFKGNRIEVYDLTPIKYKLRKHTWVVTDAGSGYYLLQCNGKDFPIDGPRHRIEFHLLHGRLSAIYFDTIDKSNENPITLWNGSL